MGCSRQSRKVVYSLNSQKPYSEETKTLAVQMQEKYGIAILPVNCEQLKKEDIHKILENVLYEFPISVIEFYMPKWVEMLPQDNRMKQELIEKIKGIMKEYTTLRDCLEHPIAIESQYPDGGMIVHDLIRADLRRLGKGYLIVKPRGFYHPLRIFLHMSRRAVHHISHTVDQPYIHLHILIQHHMGGLLGNEFGLRGSNGAASARTAVSENSPGKAFCRRRKRPSPL